MITVIKEFTESFLKIIDNKKIHIISHYDTDGITSAAIFSRTLKRLNKQFSVKIIKQLNKDEINLFPKEGIIVLLDLGSSNLEEISKIENEVFIIDHHELDQQKDLPENIHILNPHLIKKGEELCGAELTYLVSKSISEENKNLARLAIIGMIGDTMEKDINKTRNIILKDAEAIIKKGFLIYPSTRPLDKALEYSSRPFIPGVTGDAKGTYEILQEAGIERTGKIYKSLIDLDETEMRNLTTAVMLRLSSEKTSEYLGNLYLIKIFNKIEDTRELSAMINACSRMGYPETALMFCLGNNNIRKKAQKIYVKYRQNIITGLKYINGSKNINGDKYVIINAKNNIKNTIIGTLASILSFSSVYREGTIIVAMAYDEDKIKVSTRMTGRNPKSGLDLKELMDSIAKTIGGESGGHKYAAGCTINKNKENELIELLKKKLEFEVIKV